MKGYIKSILHDLCQTRLIPLKMRAEMGRTKLQLLQLNSTLKYVNSDICYSAMTELWDAIKWQGPLFPSVVPPVFSEFSKNVPSHFAIWHTVRYHVRVQPSVKECFQSSQRFFGFPTFQDSVMGGVWELLHTAQMWAHNGPPVNLLAELSVTAKKLAEVLVLFAVPPPNPGSYFRDQLPGPKSSRLFEWIPLRLPLLEGQCWPPPITSDASEETSEASV